MPTDCPDGHICANEPLHAQAKIIKQRMDIVRLGAENERLRSAIQEAATLLDFEANLGRREHQAVLREVVRQLTASLGEVGESGQ